MIGRLPASSALSVSGALAGAGAAAGVLLGGVLTSALGWRSVLFVNVPIGIAAVLLTPRLIAENRGEVANRSFDLPGAAAVTAGLSALVYALVRATTVAESDSGKCCWPDAGCASAEQVVYRARRDATCPESEMP